MRGRAAPNSTLVFVSLTGACALTLTMTAAPPQSREYPIARESAIARTFRLARAGVRTFDLRNVHGSIHVIGRDGDEIDLAATKRIGAETDADLAEAEHAVTLDVDDGGATVTVKAVEPRSPV